MGVGREDGVVREDGPGRGRLEERPWLTAAELTAGLADGGPSRGRACLELPGRQHGMPSAQVHFLARHSNVRNPQGNVVQKSPLDTYYVSRSMFDVLKETSPRRDQGTHREPRPGGLVLDRKRRHTATNRGVSPT